MSSTLIGFIGLGVMGEPICRNLAQRSGCQVVACDLNAAPLQRLANHGVSAAQNAGELTKNCNVLFASLPSGKELSELAYAKEGILENSRPGLVFVDLGTSPVALTRTLAAAFSERDAVYLDAPVARTRQAAEDGTLAVMVGGDIDSLNQVRPFMDCFASEITHCGATGSGQIAKILNNMVLFQTVAALSEAYAIATHSGVDPKVLFGALSKGSADSFALRNHGMKAILQKQFPKRAFSVEYALKDLSYALELASDGGLDAGGARNVQQLFKRAIEAGLGEDYFPVVSRILNQEA